MSRVHEWRVQLQRHFSEAIASIIYKCLHRSISKTIPIVLFRFFCHPVNLNPVTPERKLGVKLREECSGTMGMVVCWELAHWYKTPSLAQFVDFRNRESNPRNRTYLKYRHIHIMDTFTSFDDMTTLLVSSRSEQRDISSPGGDVPFDSEYQTPGGTSISSPCIIL